LNPTLAAIPGSLIRALNALKRPGDVDLGLGEPTIRPDPAPFEAALRWVRENGCPYTANAGDPALRAAIAARYAYPGLDRPENVCVTVGSQEALWLAVKAVCDPAKDEVLIVGPGYPAYAKMARLEGVAAREVGLSPDDGFRPDAARVLAAVTPATRIVLLASPANPTGRVWPDAELDALAAGLRTHGEGRPYVLLDEVYRELTYVPRATPFAARYDRTLVANSLSKSHALTGLRLGWLLAPVEVTQAVVKAHQFVATAASTYSQQVARAIFESAEPLDGQRDHYERSRAALCNLLDQAGITYLPPEGAFYCMVRLPAHLAGDSVAAAHALLERHRVVTVPGAAFGAEGWLRLSWVAAPRDLATGIARLAAFLADAP
jgi:aspartate/methionine/tyrosine aminotransferase